MKKIENDSNGNPRVQFNGTLLSKISDNIFTNVNGKNYKVATVQYAAASGEIKQATVMVYEGNYSHPSLQGKELAVGNDYRCTATRLVRDGKPSVIIQMSHLLAGSIADVDDFDFEEVGVNTTEDILSLSGNPTS